MTRVVYANGIPKQQLMVDKKKKHVRMITKFSFLTYGADTFYEMFIKSIIRNEFK
jgi:hypothetical protein